MSKKAITATVVAFVLYSCFGYLVHGYLLTGAYGHMTYMMRVGDDATRHMWGIFLGNLLTVAPMVWVYERGVQDKPWLGQGFRFGIAMEALVTAAKFITYWAVTLTPHEVALHQILGEGAGIVIVSIVIARLCK